MELPYVIAIGHQKGGTGKSSVGMNIAVELSKLYDTTLIDLDSLAHATKFNSRREVPLKMVSVKSEGELEKFLRADEGLTIVDLGGYDSDLSRAVLLLADMVITPMNDSDNEQDGLFEFEKIIKKTLEVRGDIKPFILVNRVHHADKSTLRELKGYAEGSVYEVFDTVIRDNKIHKRMLGTGKNVCELEYFSKASKEILALVQEIIKKA